jgi:hypothetical protein
LASKGYGTSNSGPFSTPPSGTVTAGTNTKAKKESQKERRLGEPDCLLIFQPQAHPNSSNGQGKYRK